MKKGKRCRKKMFKSMVALMILMSLSIATPVYAAGFYDVANGDWFAGSVDYVSNAGIMTEYLNGNFGPYDTVTRGQFATTLYRIEGAPVVSFGNRFPDVQNGLYYSDPAIWASSSGIITGYANGYFGANDNITREQMAVMMYRYAAYLGENTIHRVDLTMFQDVTTVSGFAREALQWAVANGIITGKAQGTLIDPQGNATRAECAVILQRFLAGSTSVPTPTPTPTPGTSTVPPQDVTGTSYVLNTNTMKFHYPSCSSASNINAANRADYVGYRDVLINFGYEACKRCDP